MIKEYIDNCLKITKEDSSFLVLSKHPERFTPWKNEEEALSYPIKIDKFYFTTLEEQLQFLKDEAIGNIKKQSTAEAPVTINEVTFNGGSSSASAIQGAVALAQALGETDVQIWDVNNVVATYTFEEALSISAQIAKAYRDAKLAEYSLVEQINNCTTEEEITALNL